MDRRRRRRRTLPVSRYAAPAALPGPVCSVAEATNPRRSRNSVALSPPSRNDTVTR